MRLPLNGPVYPQAFGVDQDQKPIEYNPEKAKELLKEAGYENESKSKIRSSRWPVYTG